MPHHSLGRPRRLVLAALAGTTAVGLTACASSSGGSGAVTEDGVTTMTLWTHNGGNDVELGINQQVIDDFNASQDSYRVKLQSFPQDAYNGSVTAAAAAGKLPCVLDMDGPNVPNWAWAGYLEPLDLPDEVFADQLPSTLGIVDDQLYSFGHYEVALNLITRRSILEEHGIRVPTMERPWTRQEFDEALARIKAGGDFAYPFDLGTAGGGEWVPYAYSPILQSFGGDLIDRDSYTTAEGELNGPEALAFAEWSQGLVEQGYVARRSGADSTVDFVNGKTAIVWSGSWAADAVREKYGDDALFLPPVDFGHGPKIGGGSWQWGMSSDCPAKEGALEFLEFSAQTEYHVAYAEGLGLIPATAEAAEQVEDFAPGGPYRVFYDYSEAYATPRPVTPAYPFISSVFQKAYADILSGGDPKAILDKAVNDIDTNIEQNGDYAF
jgi:multiple sugar transport system substrate-binding protein